jgi:CxxC motif-containing protein (DUF1111 family)
MFAGEAYNVEMGISNQLFPQERDETPSGLFPPTPNDNLNFTTPPSTTSSDISNPAVISDIEAFANFRRMLAPPAPVPPTPSSEKGRDTFARIGCVHCHTPVIDHRQNDCQWLFDKPECCPFQSNGESLL